MNINLITRRTTGVMALHLIGLVTCACITGAIIGLALAVTIIGGGQ